MTKQTTLDNWSEICQKVVKGEQVKRGWVHPIHTCIIQGRRHYIHSPSLEKEHPKYFDKLRSFAKKHQIQLKSDRRNVNENKKNDRRKKLLPIIFLALGSNTAIAETENIHSLQLFSHATRHISEHKISHSSNIHKALTPSASEALFIESILKKHFVKSSDDPNNINEEITRIATYYAKHPEAAALISSVADASWELKYAPHTFQTEVAGTVLNVDSVTVYFDPRSGAQLKFYDKCATKKPFCVASPADALLHEFLHLQTIVNDTEQFITQGGLGQYIYPIEHERLTILKENILYKSMSRRDHKRRPIRSEHTGRHVLVSCVTCFE